MKPHHWLGLIAGGILVWGIYHAVGAYLNFQVAGQPQRNPWRLVMVLASVLGFLGFWGAMLAMRQRRLKKLHQTSFDRRQ